MSVGTGAGGDTGDAGGEAAPGGGAIGAGEQASSSPTTRPQRARFDLSAALRPIRMRVPGMTG
jgi:hypothetical protein